MQNLSRIIFAMSVLSFIDSSPSFANDSANNSSNKSYAIASTQQSGQKMKASGIITDAKGEPIIGLRYLKRVPPMERLQISTVDSCWRSKPMQPLKYPI